MWVRRITNKKWGAGSAGKQANGRFEASSLGCRPQARSVLHCPGVWALREGPLTGAVQDESQLQEDASKWGAGNAGKQANGRPEASFWAAGRGPDPSFTALVFEPCGKVLWPELCRTKASCKRTQASGELTVQESKQMEGLKLVSRQFRKQRLALWAAGRGPDPSFTALVFELCRNLLWPELCRTKDRCKRTQASGELSVQESKQMEGLKLVILGSSESNVWHSGLPAAGPIRPSLPWCLSSAGISFGRSCAERKPAARGRKQVGSWQCRKASKCAGPIRPSLPWCLSPAGGGAVQDERQVQEDASKWGAGSAGKQANGRSEASYSRQFRKQRLALWAAGRGPDPSFTALVFGLCRNLLWPELCRTKASCKRTQASGERQCRRLAMWAVGRRPHPIRPSLPWCLTALVFELCGKVLDRSCAGRKPAGRGSFTALVFDCPGVWALREGPLTGAVQDESQLEEGTLGCRPRARSVLRCPGVWALREGPLTGAVRNKISNTQGISSESWCPAPFFVEKKKTWK